MYTKEEVSRQKQAFWTAFGKYMQPIMSAEGIPVSWINYKTGIPGIRFKMDVDHKQARIAIELAPKSEELRALLYDRLTQMKTMLEQELEGEEWVWQQQLTDEWGKTVSAVSNILPDVNFHRKEDWPAIIAFLKQRIIALDIFWSTARYGFEEFI